jgi:hypothetical protein
MTIDTRKNAILVAIVEANGNSGTRSDTNNTLVEFGDNIGSNEYGTLPIIQYHPSNIAIVTMSTNKRTFRKSLRNTTNEHQNSNKTGVSTKRRVIKDDK